MCAFAHARVTVFPYIEKTINGANSFYERMFNCIDKRYSLSFSECNESEKSKRKQFHEIYLTFKDLGSLILNKLIKQRLHCKRKTKIIEGKKSN